MIKRLLKSTFLLFVLGILSCGNASEKTSAPLNRKSEIFQTDTIQKQVIPAANLTELYFPLLENKNIGIVGNQTSLIKTGSNEHVHLVDSLLNSGFRVKKVFAPEHGFRGTADAGESIRDGIDAKTGLPIISLYGNNKKPSTESLKDLDLMIFDIQDVGARFYTYISSLHYIMEACAENNIPVLILDRPNPNGHYIDGPVLEKEHSSFVGMHPVPVVHGMSIGEYAQMINGEGWLKNQLKAELKIIKVKNYKHSTVYSLPIKPSPNLPNDKAINLYPSLCFFEGTTVNAGRGTDKQFQVFGAPDLDREFFDYSYIPVPKEGAQHPKHEGKRCYGRDLTSSKRLNKLDLRWLIEAYSNSKDKAGFFNSFFTKLAGTEKLQKQIEERLSINEIRAGWVKDLEAFKLKRKQYLLYSD
ncbi:exo-beta-N-acetylmuramidase NamZ family protein [Christiangramia salexigens]|uniref:DUF1343 domain-containing protein n=1 Tax=Christiangramia salexigens TaxID=1913577 RepID=A0A1L3J4L6_9FLAO|nr:DUF1343 domain-containing protein [Christiangramia salexigens]APG60078.1 hypothetical protein LPB144_06460 [Christiangramia salexigens]